MTSDVTPFVSVVVPVYNEAGGLRETIDALTGQTYPSDRYEVVIVDNGSDDDSLAVARDAATSDLVRVERETDVQSSYAARNTGIRETDGEILAFVDADVVAAPDWLEEGVSAMIDRGAEYAGCRVDLTHPGSALAARYDAHTGFPVERYLERYDFAPTCALFVRRNVFQEVGLFDEHLISSGDLELGQRVALSGRELHYISNARVFHPARTTLRSLLVKHFRVGRGITQRWRRYPDRYDESLSSYLIGLLPPHPLRFPQSFDTEWKRYSSLEKVGLYGVGWLTRSTSTLGRIFERLKGRSVEKSPVHLNVP